MNSEMKHFWIIVSLASFPAVAANNDYYINVIKQKTISCLENCPLSWHNLYQHGGIKFMKRFYIKNVLTWSISILLNQSILYLIV